MDSTRIGTKQAQLILTTGVDRLLKLKPGEVLQGHVVDTLPGGDVRLRILGHLIQARSSMSLPPDTGVLLRVLGLRTGDGPPEIRLQFLQTAALQGAASESPSSKSVMLEALSRELALNLPSGGKLGEGVAATLEKLIKALPNNPSTLSREVRSQLLSLIQTSLRSTGESIQNRLGAILESQAWRMSPESVEVVEALGQYFQDISKILDASLRSALENTGVTLEAKLAALARKLLAESGIPLRDPGSSSQEIEPPLQDPETLLTDGSLRQESHVGLDLKARLLQLRQLVLDQEGFRAQAPLPSDSRAVKATEGERISTAQALATVDSLLQDIESFQFLSKLTDSFYTFLPVAWKGLRDGEIAFKRNSAGPGGRSHYCLIQLDFEQFGKLTIVAMLQAGDFLVSFKTDHEGMRDALSAHLEELERMFEAQGLTLKGVNVFSEGESRLEPFERLESFESIVNIKI